MVRTCISQNERPGQLCVAPAMILLGFEEPRCTMQPQRHPGPISWLTSVLFSLVMTVPDVS